MQSLLCSQCFAPQKSYGGLGQAGGRGHVGSILTLPPPPLGSISARERNIQLSWGSSRRHDLAMCQK